MSTEVKSSHELICSQLKGALNFLRDNSEKLQDVMELYRITVLSNNQIDDIENTGFYQVNRFLSTTRELSAIAGNKNLLKYKHDGKDEREVLLRIKNPGDVAVDISNYSPGAFEYEHIIPPGNKLQLIPGSKKRNGLFIEMSFNLVEPQDGSGDKMFAF